MRMRLAAAIVAAVCTQLTGCGGGRVDARQLDWSNGLAYKHGSTTPFTGTVEWTDRVPDALQQYWSNVLGSNLNGSAASCETQFANGVIDGMATCSASNGQKIVEVSFKQEAYDGDSRFFNPNTGKLNRKLHWSGGKLDGTAEIYSDDGEHLVQKVTWKQGVQDGTTKVWSTDGTLLTDTIWSSGRTISGKINDSKGSYEYKDGQLDGPATWLARNGRDVIAKGSYSAGKRVGAWEDLGSSAKDLIEQNWMFGPGILDQALQQLQTDFNAVPSQGEHVKSNWSAGVLDGDVKIFDKHDNLILAFHAQNGILNGPFQYLSVLHGMRHFTFTNGKLNGSPDADLTESGAQSATP